MSTMVLAWEGASRTTPVKVLFSSSDSTTALDSLIFMVKLWFPNKTGFPPTVTFQMGSAWTCTSSGPESGSKS